MSQRHGHSQAGWVQRLRALLIVKSRQHNDACSTNTASLEQLQTRANRPLKQMLDQHCIPEANPDACQPCKHNCWEAAAVRALQGKLSNSIGLSSPASSCSSSCPKSLPRRSGHSQAGCSLLKLRQRDPHLRETAPWIRLLLLERYDGSPPRQTHK